MPEPLQENTGSRQEPSSTPSDRAESGRERRPRLSTLNLHEEQLQAGQRHPGDRYVRIVRPRGREFTQEAPGYLVATERALAPKGGLGRVLDAARRVLIGARIPSEHEVHERVGPAKGLAVFASDNISSSA